jgi:RimJ/RimL family protein N-acetyltransferase
VVGDCHQRQGLGTALGTALADGARALGIARFTAVMLPENTAAQRLFAHISGHLSTRFDGGTYELVADLAA